MRIKGKYIATIQLNFNFDENLNGLLPFETLKELVKGEEMDNAIVKMLTEEFGDLSVIELRKQYADMWLSKMSDDTSGID